MELGQPPMEGLVRSAVKILITGATGFIGSHLLERLAGEGHDIIVLKRSTSDTRRIGHLLNRIKCFDIDNGDLKTILEGERPELIVHLATNYGRKGETIREIVESNVEVPSVLVATAMDNGLKGFINTDTTAPDAYSFYASTKKAFLPLLNYFHKGKGLKVISIKLGYVYGPKDDDSKFIPRLIKGILAGETVDASPGMQKRDFVFVEDVVDAYLGAISLMERMDEGFVSVEIGSGESTTLREFAGIVEELASRKADVNWGALPYRKNEVFDSKADIKGAEEVLGWRPQHTLREGMMRTVEWYTGGGVSGD